jgi:hypothetical protein
MSWTNVGDILFLVGTLLSAGLIVCGGWLSVTAPEVDAHKVLGVGRRRGASPAAKPFPPRPGAALASEPFERGIEAYDDFLKLQESQ